MPEGILLSSASHILIVPDEDDEPLFIEGGKERRELRKQLERGVRAEEENRELRERIRRLQEELRRLKTSFPVLATDERTAEAVGAPSSGVFYRRPHPIGELKGTGGQPGHRGQARERPVPNAPKETYTLERCPDCGGRLGEPCDVLRRVITDLPPPEPKIFEVENARYRCSSCGARVVAPDPYPAHRHFGLLLMSRVVHLRMLGISIEKVVDYMREGHGVELSSATVLSMEAFVANALGPLYERLKSQVRNHSVVHADETKFRARGENGWLWVFVTLSSVVYRIANSRGHDVVEEVLGGFEGTLVSDAWKSYDVVTTAKRQLDLLHVNR